MDIVYFFYLPSNILALKTVLQSNFSQIHMSFQARLQYLISWILHIPEQRVFSTSDLFKDLDIVDTDFNLLIFQLENYYQTEFSNEQIGMINTVQDIEDLLTDGKLRSYSQSTDQNIGHSMADSETMMAMAQ